MFPLASHTGRPAAPVRTLVLCLTAAAFAPGLVALAAAQDLGGVARGASAAPPPPSVLEHDGDGRTVIRAIAVPEPPVIDGKLDETIYERVFPASGFIQQEPREGQPATDKTEVWVLYDDKALYIAARCWQPADVRLVANEMRRDSFAIFQNDNFGFILDTFRDGRNGFLFYTNPVAGLADSYVTDERDSNRDWNTVWDTKTGRFEDGWTVEMAIPFKSLRFPPGKEQTWGINFRRIVRDRPELSYLMPIPASAGPRGMMRVSLAAPLVGVTAPPPGLNLEVKPFGIVQTQIDKEATIPPDDFDGDAGFDVKYGVTKSLTADFTYNTDFAQVEEDELQVNLTRFNLFFPEKREFFLEGQGIFSFGGVQNGPMGGRQGPPSNTPVLFFSRRIGINEDATVPIDVGGRLTGKAGPWSLGFLDVQTADSVEAQALATNFAVARVKRDILRRSAVGVIATNRSRTVENTGSNQVFGLDGNFAFYENVSIVGYFAKSWTSDLEGHDTSYRGQFDYSGDRYGLEVEHLLVDENFNPEVGFLRREAFRRSAVQGRFSPRPKSIPWIRKWGVEPSLEYITDPGGVLESRQAQLTGRIELSNGDNFGLDFERNFEALDEPFEITDEVTIPIGAYRFNNVRARYELGPQRRVSGGVSLNAGGFYDGTRQEVGWRGRVELSSQLSLEPTLSFNWVRMPYGDFDTQLVGVRTTYTISPRMLASALLQYNSASEIASANLRYRWEYRPGSDLFVVYSEGRDTEVPGTPTLSSRSFAVKLTRMFRF